MTDLAIGVDIGGSGIKAGAVDLASGELRGERLRIVTPEPSTPAAVIAATSRLIKRIIRAEPDAAPATVRVGVGVPSVVIDGVTRSAANIDPGWVDYPAAFELQRTLSRGVAVVNDADAAGVAEMRFGAGRDERGVVFVLTLGTGVGSALFVDGILVPNTELGHMEIRGRDAERRSAAAARVRRGLSWKAWATDLDEHLIAIDRLFSPRLFILGGGVSKNPDKFIPFLTVRVPIVPAKLRNDAGIVGAAMFASERGDDLAGAPGAAAAIAEEIGTTEPTEPMAPGVETSGSATVSGPRLMDVMPTISSPARADVAGSGSADPADPTEPTDPAEPTGAV